MEGITSSSTVFVVLSSAWMLATCLPSSRQGDTDTADPWRLCTDSPLNNSDLWPTLANGHVGTVVFADKVFMNGLYNGNGTETKRARIPGFISLESPEISLSSRTRQYCLNLKEGTFTETVTGDHWSVEVQMYAHRSLNRLLVTDLYLRTDGQQPDLQVNLSVNRGNESADIDLKNGTSPFERTRYIYGNTLMPETPSSGKQAVHVIYSEIPEYIHVTGGEARSDRYTYMMAVSPFVEDAYFFYSSGLRLQTRNLLRKQHVDAWQQLWDSGRVDIFGNTELASSAYSALYYILSSIPTVTDPSWPFIGLSPGDLGHGNIPLIEYGGHLFWDQDTWMFPPVLCLHGNLAKTLVNTRIRILDVAYNNAKLVGYSGARYAWESAYTGYEVTPSRACSMYEHHVTGDVALGFKQYLQMSRDTDLLQHGRLQEAIIGIADFWKSRVVFNDSKGQYEIFDVMPPDEWNYPVNNSAYTNAIARLSLLLPAFAAELLGNTSDPVYKEIASKIYIPLNRTLQYHPEFDGYLTNVSVKQADVVMLGFPLMFNMTQEQRQNDLTIYEKVTPGGPAMTWAIFSIGWLELQQYEKAGELFLKQLRNKWPPFNVWTEFSHFYRIYGYGATNFITGQGGFLQSLVFGYGGIRIYDDHITLRCTQIPNTSGFRIKHFDYLGSAMDISCNVTSTDITLHEAGTQLFVGIVKTGKHFPLEPGITLSLPNQKLYISPTPRSSGTEARSSYSVWYLTIWLISLLNRAVV